MGQKSYNGVAVVSRHKLNVRQEGLPGFEDANSRYLETSVTIDGVEYITASIYLPNGNPPYNNPDDDSRYDYKLQWMDALYRHAEELLRLRKPVVLGGDFNVILTDDDVYDPEAFRRNALFREEVKQRLTALQYLGFMMHSERCIRVKTAIPIGIMPAVPCRTIWGCVLIICFCQRTQWIVSMPAKWTRRRVWGLNRQTIRF
ncbi:MAG: exodeoxyribonuclease III [Alphaproteobacteria bacterium]